MRSGSVRTGHGVGVTSLPVRQVGVRRPPGPISQRSFLGKLRTQLRTLDLKIGV
jgi:hypothetical protein